MKPTELGTLFEELAERNSPTTVHLSRPLDVAPDAGVEYPIPALAELVGELSACLHSAGLRSGGVLAVVKPNHWDYVLLACAAARLGAIPALLSDGSPPSVLSTLLRRLTPAVLVAGAGVAAAAAREGEALTAGRTIVLGGGERDGGEGHSGERDGGASEDDRLTLDRLRGGRVPPPVRRRDDETLVITHTSGTTGVPKLVEHSKRTVIDRLARFEARRMPVVTSRRGDTLANADPFCHGRAIPWTASVLALRPRRVLILAEGQGEASRALLERHPPTVVEATPAVFVGWRGLAGGDGGGVFRNVRLFINTFDAVHPPVVRSFLHASRRRRPLWIQVWGQTETGPLTFRPLTRRALARTGERHPTTRHLGWPVPGRTRLRVVDPRTLRPVGAGRPGLVLARTRARCVGYTGEPERWSAKVAGEWWNTGDLGRLTRTGALVLLDREVDSVPGESCVELEDVLEDRLPEVLEATVLAVRGRPPVPVLVTDAGAGPLDAGRWQRAIRDLPPLGPPVQLPWQDVPRTGTGKVRRHLLRAQLFPDGTAEAHGTGRWT